MRRRCWQWSVGMSLVVVLAAMPGCKKKPGPASSNTGSAGGMSAEAMLAMEPDPAVQMAPPAMESPGSADAMDAMADAGGIKKAPGGPLKKGSAAYNATLRELTSSVDSSDPSSDKMKSIVIVGKCEGDECKKALSGRDHLSKGSTFGDLDDRARSVGGPSSGSGGRRGLAGRSGRPPASSKTTPKSKVSAYVPPVKLKGAAGSRARAKIRARVYGLRSCHQRLLAKSPKAVGAVKIRFVIQPNGRVKNVSVTGTPAGVISCVKGKVGRWHLGQVGKSVPYGPFTVRFSIK